MDVLSPVLTLQPGSPLFCPCCTIVYLTDVGQGTGPSGLQDRESLRGVGVLHSHAPFCSFACQCPQSYSAYLSQLWNACLPLAGGHPTPAPFHTLSHQMSPYCLPPFLFPITELEEGTTSQLASLLCLPQSPGMSHRVTLHGHVATSVLSMDRFSHPSRLSWR